MTWAFAQDALVITLNVASMLAMGLELTPSRLAVAMRRAGPLALGLALNLAAAPLLAWALISGLALPASFALGLLLCAVAPGGNTGPLLAANAGGDIAYAVALVVVLSFASVLAVPWLTAVLAPAGSGDLGAHAGTMVRMILGFQIAPLCAGMLVRRLHVVLAQRAAPLARRLGNLCLGTLAVGLLVLKGDVVLDAGLPALLAIEAFVLAGLASGRLLGPVTDPAARALGLVTCTRNLSLGMLLAAQVFRADDAVLLGVLTYGLFWICTAFPASFWLRRFGAR